VYFRLSGVTSVSATVGSALFSNLPFSVDTTGTVFGGGTGFNNATSAGFVLQASATTMLTASAVSATPNIFGSATYQTS
jgi:hypothetical protein